MRRTLAALAAATLLGSGATACTGASQADGDSCQPRATQTVAKHIPRGGGRAGGSRSRPRTNPKPKPAPVYVPAHVDGDDCDD